MSGYLLTWITKSIAVGHAPMSYEELESIKEQGIDVIVNLCGEFSDLHEIEENAGFEVFWIPIPDETAPTMTEMEKGLESLDEAVYLGKKVLVHCRHGIGRTGTFITAYLLRRGFALKKASKILKSTRANPTNFSQWWLLRKFGKKEGQLKLSEPTPENRNNASSTNLDQFYSRYERLLEKVDGLPAALTIFPASPCCSPAKTGEGDASFSLELIEALYLNNKVNATLSAGQRLSVIEKAATSRPASINKSDEDSSKIPISPGTGARYCSLRDGHSCLLHQFRPIHCRLRQHHADPFVITDINNQLTQLSREVFFALFDQQIDEKPPVVSCTDSVSGKFIQSYFQFLASRGKTDEK